MIGLTLFLTSAPTLWATFDQGDGAKHVYTVTFSPRGAVNYKLREGSTTRSAQGSYAVVDGVVTVTFPQPKEAGSFPLKFNLMKWGGETFLVADDEVAYFAYRYNNGWRGEPSGEFLRSGNKKGKLAGVPDAFQDLLKAPLSLHTCTLCYPGEFPVSEGAKAGLAKGTILTAIKDQAVFYVDDVDSTQAMIQPLAGREPIAGEKFEASKPPFAFRSLLSK